MSTQVFKISYGLPTKIKSQNSGTYDCTRDPPQLQDYRGLATIWWSGAAQVTRHRSAVVGVSILGLSSCGSFESGRKCSVYSVSLLCTILCIPWILNGSIFSNSGLWPWRGNDNVGHIGGGAMLNGVGMHRSPLLLNCLWLWNSSTVKLKSLKLRITTVRFVIHKTQAK